MSQDALEDATAPKLRDRLKAFFRRDQSLPSAAPPEDEPKPILGHDFSKIRIHAEKTETGSGQNSAHSGVFRLEINLPRLTAMPEVKAPWPAQFRFRLATTQTSEEKSLSEHPNS